ncbi:regulator of G-protein signaling 9-binding protein-like [Chlamydotis macqueenii]
MWGQGDAGASVPDSPRQLARITAPQGPAAAPHRLSSRGDEGGTLLAQGAPAMRGDSRISTAQLLGHRAVGRSSLHPWGAALQLRGTELLGEPGVTAEGPGPAPSSHGAMALRRGDACGTRGMAGTCAAAQAALCKATAGHRQLVLQLGGSADSPRLREERRRRSAEARELSTGLRHALLAGLRQAPVSPEEQRELERLWVLFLSALELFLQDLRRAHHLCQLFSAQGGGAALLRTGLGGQGLPGRKGSRRGGGPAQPPAALRLEEEIEQVRAMLAEMESGANIPPWTVEATQAVGTGSTTAPTSGAVRVGPHAGHCCRVL